MFNARGDCQQSLGYKTRYWKEVGIGGIETKYDGQTFEFEWILFTKFLDVSGLWIEPLQLKILTKLLGVNNQVTVSEIIYTTEVNFKLFFVTFSSFSGFSFWIISILQRYNMLNI